MTGYSRNKLGKDKQMARFVYKGKINGNDVVYKEGCIHGILDRFEGGLRQNIMEVVTENGKKFRFRNWIGNHYLLNCLAEGGPYKIHDSLDEVIIEEEGKKTLKYFWRKSGAKNLEGKRTSIVLEKASKMYNGIRIEILKELKENPKDKKLEKRVVTEEQIRKEVEDLFDTAPKLGSLCLYKDDTEKFIELFSSIKDKNEKKELLNAIFKCEYENKEVIDWLNKNEQDLMREVGFNS